MTLMTKISCLLIGICFAFRLHSPIAFGICIGISLILIIVENRKNITLWFKKSKLKPIFPFVFVSFVSFFLSSSFSIMPIRSFPVIIYFYSFLLFSFIIYNFLKDNKNAVRITSIFFLLSTFFCVLLVFFYNILNYESIYLYHQDGIEFAPYEIKKYKGFVNLLTILVFLCPYIEKILGHQRLIISVFVIILIFPVIILTNCKAALLGLAGGTIILLILKFFDKNMFYKKKIIISLTLISIFLGLSVFNVLEKQLNMVVNLNEEFKISQTIIDAHRQIIWGFSYKEFKKNWFLGTGPDTSNFVENSQIEIGHPSTGDMTYIPSHPHNFLIELLLETGFFGLISFFILIFYTNLLFVKKSDALDFKFLLFFNGYFWTSSLVNFSFWAAWWQGSYFIIVAILFSIISNKNLNLK